LTTVEFREVKSQEETQISAYGGGGFRIGERRSKGSILITPKGYYPWAAADIKAAALDNLRQITAQAAEIDLLLIGTGENMAFLNKEVRRALEGLNIAVDVMATGAAARTYNVLLLEGRKVAAALIAVE